MMYLSGWCEIDAMAAITLSLIEAIPVSTIRTPCSPACTVMLPPAPTSMYTLFWTGRTSISPAAGAVNFGGQTAWAIPDP